MARSLAALLAAILTVGCGEVTDFEPGSSEAIIAGWIAEWGGDVGEYRSILAAEDCRTLERMEESIAKYAATVPDTPQWREEQGYVDALAFRREQLDC